MNQKDTFTLGGKELVHVLFWDQENFRLIL